MWEKGGFAKANSVLFDETDDKSSDGNNRKNEEENFRDFNRTSSDPAKTKDCSDKCNDQKNYRIVQHERLLGYENMHISGLRFFQNIA